MSSGSAGALLGLMCALGLSLVTTRLIALRPPSLLERIAPYVPASAQVRAKTSAAPGVFEVLIALVRPMLGTHLSRAPIEHRIAHAGLAGVHRFRLDQAAVIGLGAAIGCLVAVLLIARGASAMCLPLLIISGAIAGAIWSDRQLSRRISLRQAQMARELPAVAELLAFAVAAGESPAAAIERVSRTLGGALAAELQRCLGQVRGGQALDLALRDLAIRVGSPQVESFVDAFVIALERGSPLAEVLRAQAGDVRAAERRALMEKAGRKEVSMLIPVVFLILPTVVLIAVFPGVQGLQLVIRS